MLLALVFAATASGSTPKWACSLSEKPSAHAKADTADPKRTQVDALRLDRVAAAEQKVPAVTKDSLPSVVAAAETGVLVVFFAPWCGHCKHFVLQGEDGTAESAPIEKLNTQLEAAKGPKVVKFNVDAGPTPEGYEVQYIPTIYLVAKSGEKTAFEGDPSDLAGLQKFALGKQEEKHEEEESGLSDMIPVLASSNATKKVVLIQTAQRLHPWASITAEAAKLAGKPQLAELQTAHVGYPEPLDPHGKNLALTSVVNTAEDVSPLGRLSEQLDGSLQVNPMSALSSWVSDTPAVRTAPKPRQASLLATYNRDLA
jgi:thiol-disulfide isomerase/thioredoxin